MASSLRFAAQLIDSEPRRFRYELVWSKSMATGFLNVAHRPLRSHEFVLVFWRERGTYHAQMHESGVPIRPNTRGGLEAPKRDYSGTNYGRGTSGARSRAGETSRFPRSVVAFGGGPTRSKERRHHQQKPVALMRYLGGDLLGPRRPGGSGSVGAACAAAGRRFSGWDVNPAYGESGGQDG